MIAKYVVGAVASTLLIAPQLFAQGVLTGTVREDSTGRPIPSVEVTIQGQRKQARTDSVGQFRITKVEPGVHRVQLRRLGYLPGVVVVRVLPPEQGDTRVDDMTLIPTPTELGKVTVEANAASTNPLGLAAEGFEERRKLGFGKFIDANTLRANEHKRLPDLIGTLQGAMVRPFVKCPVLPNGRYDTRRCDTDWGRRYVANRSGCAMRVFLDNALVYAGGRGGKDSFDPDSYFDINSVLVENLAGVEVFRSASEVPGNFGGTGADCGVVLLWSRRQ